MSDQDVFDANNQPSESPKSDPLAEIKTEDGRQKYSSNEEALKALKHSQEHIRKLEDELKNNRESVNFLKEKVEKLSNMEANIDVLLKGREADDQRQSTSLSEDTVRTIVSRTLEEERAVSIRKTNRDMVSKELGKNFPNNAKEVITKKAQELGTSVENLGKLAEENPTLVLSLFKDEFSTKSPVNPTTTSVSFRTEAPQSTVRAPEGFHTLGTKDKIAFLDRLREEAKLKAMRVNNNVGNFDKN